MEDKLDELRAYVDSLIDGVGDEEANAVLWQIIAKIDELKSH